MGDFIYSNLLLKAVTKRPSKALLLPEECTNARAQADGSDCYKSKPVLGSSSLKQSLGWESCVTRY